MKNNLAIHGSYLYHDTFIHFYDTLIFFSHTVIGRDRDGNDVMADGSIKLRTQTISKEVALHSNSTASPSQPDSHLSFDISACIGSPEKLSPVQVDSVPLDVDHLPTPHILRTKD